jgi:hypothetical protein
MLMAYYRDGSALLLKNRAGQAPIDLDIGMWAGKRILEKITLPTRKKHSITFEPRADGHKKRKVITSEIVRSGDTEWW